MVKDLGILKSLHKALMKEADLSSVLEFIVSSTIKLLNADRCTLYIYDPIKKELWSQVSSKLEVNEIRLGLDKGIAGYVGKTKEMVNVCDAYNDHRFNKEVDEITNYKTKSILACAMINPSNQLIGVIEAINKNTEDAKFNDSDEFLISIIASISAVAIQQAQLYKSNFELRQYNESIIENVENAIIVLDKNFDTVLINPAFEIIFVLNAEDTAYKNIYNVHPVFKELQEKIERLKKGAPSYIIEKECIIEGKTRYLNFHFSLIGDSGENSTGFIIVIDDVTDEILIKKEKEKEENLSLIGKMLTTVIHDVKNPLSAIRGFAELIGIKSKDEEIKEYTKIISKEIFRLNDMTREILDFAKGQTTFNFSAISISEFASDLKIFLEKEFETRNINFDLKISDDFEVMIDAAKIHRAVINIAKNAAEAMEENKASAPKKKSFKMELKSEGETFSIKLADNGPGIPKEILRKIFQPFYTRGKRLGTGLGLAIVEKMIADHRGKIKIWSEEGKGTVFTIILPKVQKII